MKLTKRDFLDLGIWMIVFGIIIGIVFPFFTIVLGVDKSIALKPTFIILSIIAGILVGLVNILLAKGVIGKKLKILIKGMSKVERNLVEDDETAKEDCKLEDCLIKVESIDEIGKSAQAFNNLTNTLFESLQTQQLLSDYQVMLTTNLNISFLSQNSLKYIMMHLQANAGAILLEKNGELYVADSKRIDNPLSLQTHESIIEVYNSGKQITMMNPKNIKIDNVLVNFTPSEIIIEPIMYKGIVIGVLILASDQVLNYTRKQQVSLFTNTFALAINNSIEHSQLQELVAIDPLTKAYNRRFGMKRLKEEYIRSVRNQNPLGIMMIDLDDFKKVNDTYGHMVGDKILIALSQIASSTLRESDILMRYGGEEFLIILPGALVEDTAKVAERIRRIANDYELKHNDSIINVTVSIGVASYPQSNVESEEKLIVIADNALYLAKDNGKNRVEKGL
ncbi:MAG: GGDEF domain-containing protein [Clostridiales bacterium]|nr:GGDEF domain-containing protein [Clostridiales bacterium]